MRIRLVPALLLLAACSGAEATEREVADIAATQYYILRQAAGPSVNSCMQAGMVAEAFVRAGDLEAAREWREIEAKDCDEAGYEKHTH